MKIGFRTIYGNYMGGLFYFKLSDESGNVISQNDLSKVYKEPLIFNSLFQIQFDDYNGDDDIDFTIGQYASVMEEIISYLQYGRMEE